jgi:predicted Zn finger-like uncharacterized protein
MSLITRCPACDTMFKVVPDQLRISEGWVRCGQCGEIFNASQHLVAPEAPPSAADRAPAPTPAPTPAVVTAPAPPPEERHPSPSPWVTPAAGAAAPNPFEQKVWDMAPAIDDPATEPEPESASEPEPEPEPSPASDPIADPLPSAPAAEAATAPFVDPVAPRAGLGRRRTGSTARHAGRGCTHANPAPGRSRSAPFCTAAR